MLSKFTLDDVCESLLATPANIAVFRVETNDRFVIMGMSPSLEALYDVEPGDAVGREVADFRFDEKARRRLRESYMSCRDSGAVVSLDEEINSKDGSRFWTNRILTPIFNPDQKVVALVSTVFDITELVSKRRTLLRTLSTTAAGFVTLCAWCRKIEEDGQWTPLDQYVRAHPESDVVICPDCKAAGAS